jgi:hypothetical protein
LSLIQEPQIVQSADQKQETPSCLKSHGVKVQLKKMIDRGSFVYQSYPLGWV